MLDLFISNIDDTKRLIAYFFYFQFLIFITKACFTFFPIRASVI